MQKFWRFWHEEGEETIKNLEEIFTRRVEWYFDVAAEQVTAQYINLPEEVFDVLVAPLTRDKEYKNKIFDPSATQNKTRNTKRPVNHTIKKPE